MTKLGPHLLRAVIPTSLLLRLSEVRGGAFDGKDDSGNQNGPQDRVYAVLIGDDIYCWRLGCPPRLEPLFTQLDSSIMAFRKAGL